ncbi:PAS domain-containing protein [Muricoccus vinaceus]|uniref:histidine kinase n=1 Tax=Muricoccus vinaceus TaxID=424704 RepID=A0ABV6IRF2_9PROT
MLTEIRGRRSILPSEARRQPPVSARRAPTLRRRVLVFAFGAALPLLLLAGGAVWQQNRAERLRAEEGLVARTHAMALLLDREFAGAERLLLALSGSPALARGDLPTFWSEMRSAGTAYGARAVNLIGPDGHIRLSTSWLPGERPEVMSIGPAAEALATGRSVVGNLFVSPSVGEWSVGVAMPILAPDASGFGPVRHVLGLIVPRERLLSTLTEQRMPPGAVASALDRELTIVARTARDRETLAAKPPAEVLAAIGPRAGIVPPFTALEGERVHAAYALAPQSGFRVKVTVPEAVLEASLRQALLPTLLIGTGLLSVTLVFGVLFADRLSRSLRRLGEPEMAGIPRGTAVREIDELGVRLARRAEARERAAAETRALFDASPVGVVRSDAGGRVTAANDAFLRIIGMTRKDLAAGRVRWDDLTPPEWIGRDEAAIAEAARDGACAPYQKEYVRPDGTRVPVLLFFAFHDRASGAASAFVVDLSGWEATEAALARAHEQMRLAMGAARIFSWDWNVVSGAVQWSGGLEAALGMAEESFGGTVDDFRALVHRDDLPRVEAALRSALADEEPYDIEFRMRRADGGERWVVARGTVLRDGTGRPTRMIGIDFDITDRKRAELALAESEARLRHALDEIQAVYASAPIGLALLDRDLRYCHVNAALAAINGRPVAEHLGRMVVEVVPEIWQRVEPVLRAVLDRGEAVSGMPVSGRTGAAGNERHWLASYHPVRDDEGEVRGVSVAVLPVRGEQHAAPGLATNEARLHDLLETLDQATLMARDRSGTIRYWSGGCERLYGWTAKEAVGQVSHDLLGTVFPVTASEIEAALECDGEWSGDLRHRTRAGEEIVVAAHEVLRRNPDGTAALVIEALVDVTVQRRAERVLRESEERLRLAQEAAAIGVWEWDLATDVRHWSDRQFVLHGLDPAAAIASRGTWQATVHPDDLGRAENAIARALREGGELRMDYRVMLPGGDERWLAGRGIVLPVRGATGQRLVGVTIDVTEGKAAEAALVRANAELESRVAERTRALREAAEELQAEMRRREQTQTALVQAQKLEALGQLTGSVAHDFNNVLAAVMGSLRLIERRAGGNEQILALARGGEQSAERAAALIRQLMAFARREDLTPIVVGPARVLEEVEQMLRRSVGTGVTFSVSADPDAWPVLTDPHRLEVALLNLAVNARDAMEGVGSLTVEARNAAAVPGSDRPEGVAPKQDYVVISVRDSGAGMSPEVLAQASEPFFTTKPRGQGTGLGLAMVHGFARQSGGVLRLLSAPGEGTTAEIWLPRAAGNLDVAVAQMDVEPNPALHGSATILVVDDDDQVRLVTATQLRDLGYDVLEANNLASAMVQASAAPRLDLVVTDITMPGGRGPDLALRLRAIRPSMPILFVSGYGDPGALASEVVLAKPFTPGELSWRVLTALDRLPTPPHERMLMRLSRPELRGIYLGWRALRNVAGGGNLPTPEALDIAGHAGADHAFTVAVEGQEGEPRMRFVRFGAALERRLGRPLEGQEAGVDLEGDEVFGGLREAYHRSARLGVPCHDYARFGFGDGGEPVYFERLLLPLAADGGPRPTHLVGMAFFSDPA